MGTALIVFWCCFALVVGVLAATRKLALAWLAMLLRAAVCVFYLSYSPTGYLSDLESTIMVPSGGG